MSTWRFAGRRVHLAREIRYRQLAEKMRTHRTTGSHDAKCFLIFKTKHFNLFDGSEMGEIKKGYNGAAFVVFSNALVLDQFYRSEREHCQPKEAGTSSQLNLSDNA